MSARLVKDIEMRGHLIASSTLLIQGDDVSSYTCAVCIVTILLATPYSQLIQ